MIVEQKEIKKLCKGRSEDQQQIIHYFCDESGCFGGEYLTVILILIR